LADTIVEDVSFSGNNAAGDVSVFGPSFNPALGTLDSVSAVVTGTYTPYIYLSTPGDQTTASVQYFFAIPGYANIMGTAGNVTLTGIGCTQCSSAFTGLPVDFDFLIDSFPNLSNFIGGQPAFATTQYGNVQAYARPAQGESWGSYDDLSSFSGQIALTYTYTVPEPSTFVLLAFGACLVSVASFSKRVLF
jgi:hypothetical protein